MVKAKVLFIVIPVRLVNNAPDPEKAFDVRDPVIFIPPEQVNAYPTPISIPYGKITGELKESLFELIESTLSTDIIFK